MTTTIDLTDIELAQILGDLKGLPYKPSENYGKSFGTTEPNFCNDNCILVQISNKAGKPLGQTRLPQGEVELFESGCLVLARLVMDERQLTKMAIDGEQYISIQTV